MNQLQTRLEYYYYLANVGVVRALPESAAQRLARAVALRMFARGGRRQRAALANLALAYPDLAASERLALARESWVQTAWGMVDAARARDWEGAAVLNYLALHGEVGNFGGVLPGSSLGTSSAVLDSLTAFAPLARFVP